MRRKSVKIKNQRTNKNRTLKRNRYQIKKKKTNNKATSNKIHKKIKDLISQMKGQKSSKMQIRKLRIQKNHKTCKKNKKKCN